MPFIASNRRYSERRTEVEKWPAGLRRRRFGLPAARAPAHNLIGQQGLKISIPKIDRLPSVSVEWFSPTRFICRRRPSMIYENLARRQINADR
jgi:hypothetical protein